MSFLVNKSSVSEGDTVLVYVNFQKQYTVNVTPGESFQCAFGEIKHTDLVGHRYGTKFQCKNGWVHILEMCPRLWTNALNHRTQILYTTDISLILMQLELRPGSTVVEAGTGSGSLSHTLARTVAPSGHLYTFDFHQSRSEQAASELAAHGFSSSLVTCRHRDVISDGFDLANESADAVFLDLPSPWKAVQHAYSILKPMGRICTFSPCIEQVQKTCQVLKDLKFTEETTFECLLRSFDVKKLTFHRPGVDSDSMGDGEIPEKLSKDESETGDTNGKAKRKLKRESPNQITYHSAMPSHKACGHSGYLTFATKPFN